jgi:glutamate dehydrogenase
MMDWAARKWLAHVERGRLTEMRCWTVHARTRGATSWWKSFTTGKSASKLGGVPHDVYGMTSLSVRQYVLGIYKHLGLREKDVTKLQTGGPDGDLGSSKLVIFVWDGVY